MRNAIIDCDPGNGVAGANVDDALALAFAVRHPGLHVAAIWTVFGNTTSDLGYSAARKLLNSLGKERVTLRRGSDVPLSGERDRWIQVRRDAARASGAPRQWKQPDLGNGAEQPRGRQAQAAIASPHDLAQDILACHGHVSLVAIGPLTNIARLIRDEPWVIDRIERIYAMGGTLGYGNLVDTNFAVDPLAARIVLGSGIPITLIPLDVTRTTHLSRARWRKICDNQMPWMKDMDAWLTPWLEYSENTRPVDGMWIHDLVAVAAMTDPDVISSQPATVRIGENGKLYRDLTGRSDEAGRSGAMG